MTTQEGPNLNSNGAPFLSTIRHLRLLLSGMMARVLGSRFRFVVPAATVLIWKLMVAVYLVARFGGFHAFATPQMRGSGIGIGDPFYLFVGLDSYHYMQIAQSGYTDLQSFAYFPGYPAVIRLFYLITNDIYLSAAIPAFVFGILFVPVFQSVAEKYMDRESSIRCTLVASFFPMVFFFTSIAYSESLFVFLSLLFWFEYLNHRIARANVVLAAASLTRPFGVLLAVPLIIELILKRQLRDLAYLAIPFFAILGWLVYGLVSTGYWLAFRVAEVSFWNEASWFTGWAIPFLGGEAPRAFGFSGLASFAVVISGYLAYLTLQEDWRLGTLSFVMSASIILFAGTPDFSYMRYFSFIFPIWLLAGKVKPWGLVAIYCVFMSVSSMITWYAFASGLWVG